MSALTRAGSGCRWRALLPRLTVHAVMRPRVVTLLDRRFPLTVLAAPTGYGKTTAMVGWLGDRFSEDDLVARVDVTPGMESDQVWAELLRFVGGTPTETGSAQQELEDWLQQIDEPVMLAVDSSQHLADSNFLEDLAHLLRRHSGVHAIVATRQLPTSFGDVIHTVDTTVITEHQLAFRDVESMTLLTAYIECDEAKRCHNLHDAVGGWPTLVHRAAIGLAEQSQNVDDGVPWSQAEALDVARESAARYITETLLPGILDEKQLDLARLCSLVGTVDDTEVDLLESEGPDVPSRLADLVHAGVLTARTEIDRVTYVMPELVADALRAKAELTLPADQVRSLRVRFIEHWIEQEQWVLAITVALELDDPEMLTDIVARGWISLSVRHESLLRAALRQIPVKVLEANPLARSVRGVLVRASSPSGVESSLPEDPAALKVLANQENVDRVLLKHLTLMLGDRGSGHLDLAKATSKKLLTIVDEARTVQPEVVRGLAPMMYAQFAMTCLVSDDLIGAEHLFQQVIEIGEDDPSGLALPAAHGSLALICVLVGRLEEAYQWLELAEQHPVHPGWLGRRTRTAKYLAQAWLTLENFDLEAFQPLLGELIAEHGDDELWGFIVEIRSMYELILGDSWSAIDRNKWLRRRLGHQAPPGSYADLALTYSLADHELVLGHGTRTAQALEAAPPRDPATGMRRATLALMSGDPEAVLAEPFNGQSLPVRRRAHVALLRACAHLALGDLVAARISAVKALDHMAAHDFRVPLHSVPTHHLVLMLEKLDLSDEHRAIVEGVLERGRSPLPAHVEVITLTEREAVVLTGLADGKSVQQMATEQYLSANTIKSQCRTLYRKLDVSSKDEAVTRAEELGVIDEVTRIT